ncbi:MAG: hypothetical protein ACRC7H_06570, partial [Plesiomonas shigelloides]
MDEYVGRFLDIAEQGTFGEEELAVLFNTGLREPLSCSEMRPMDFDAVWLTAAARSESATSSNTYFSSPLVAIPESGPLQIGVVG